MPAAIAIPLITAGASAGAGVYGAHKAASAAQGAAKTQSQAANAAAARTQAATQQALSMSSMLNQQGQEGLEPYAALGRGAGAALGHGLGLPSQPPPQTMAGMLPQAQPRMITIQAPNGQTKQLPENVARAFIQQGAKVVG